MCWDVGNVLYEQRDGGVCAEGGGFVVDEDDDGFLAWRHQVFGAFTSDRDRKERV